MSYDKSFEKQVELLIKVLPSLNVCQRFALKGGTAINLFFQNMPRLSVDIDLTYTEIESRKIFLENLILELNCLKNHLLNSYTDIIVQDVFNNEGILAKLLISQQEVQIKIEPNLIFRGYVYESETVELCESAQEKYLRAIEIRTMSKNDVYAGKLCAHWIDSTQEIYMM